MSLTFIVDRNGVVRHISAATRAKYSAGGKIRAADYLNRMANRVVGKKTREGKK